jgi:tetratricopeptide (TPR) repeat protein
MADDPASQAAVDGASASNDDANSDILLPPSVDELPLQPGSFVVLHSLKATHLNSTTGEVVSDFDETSQRYPVKLDEENKTILVKPGNLKRIPLAPLQTRQEAQRLSNKIVLDMQSAYESRAANLMQILSSMQQHLQQILTVDRCCVMGHAALGQLCTMMNNQGAALQHLQRGVAHLYALEGMPNLHSGDRQEFVHQLRYELAVCYGGLGNQQQEEAQLRQLLDEQPDSAVAWYGLSQSLIDQRRLDEAIEVLQELIETCPEENSLGVPPSHVRQVKQLARQSLNDKLQQRLSELSNPSEPDDQLTLKYAQLFLSFVNNEQYDVPLDHQARVLMFRAAAYTRMGRFDDAQQDIAAAHELENDDTGYTFPPTIKSFVEFHEGALYEARGDKTSSEAEKHALYEQALASYAKSEATQSDPAARSLHMRVQLKLNPNLASAFSEDGTCGISLNIGSGTEHLTELPPGPPRQEEEKQDKPEQPIFVGSTRSDGVQKST